MLRRHPPAEYPYPDGIRHEDIIFITFITESGPENMTKWTGSPKEPAVV